jgi:hypothetical protein
MLMRVHMYTFRTTAGVDSELVCMYVCACVLLHANACEYVHMLKFRVRLRVYMCVCVCICLTWIRTYAYRCAYVHMSNM